jgi:type IX secretion system PorP/SprF family membrane protein
MKKLILFLYSCLLIAFNLQAQDLYFSNFYETGVYRNPGLIGIFASDYKATVIHRNQWSEAGYAINSSLINLEGRKLLKNGLVNDYISYAFTAAYDKVGSLSFTNSQMYASVGINKSLENAKNTYITAGFSGGYYQNYFDISKIKANSQYINDTYDPTASILENFSGNVVNKFDLSAGISLVGEMGSKHKANYYIGLGAIHAATPSVSFFNSYYAKLSRKFVFNAGLNYKFNKKWSLTVHSNLSQQSEFNELIYGAYINYGRVNLEKKTKHSFSIGCFNRQDCAIIPMMKFEFDGVVIATSYDYANSIMKTRIPNLAVYEISLTFKRQKSRDKDPRDLVICPSFDELLIYE